MNTPTLAVPRSVRISSLLLLVSAIAAFAQPFTGTNDSGSAQEFRFSISSGTTNLSLIIQGSESAYSHLFLRKSLSPTASEFDFASKVNGGPNAIHLEQPELEEGDYVLLVQTPTSSGSHSFEVTATFNKTDIRTSAKPASKRLQSTIHGTLFPGQRQFFQIDVSSGLPGWRLALNATGLGNPDLFLRQGAAPEDFAADKASIDQLVDTLVLTDQETTPGTYYIGVFLPETAAGSSDFTLYSEPGYLTDLVWDPGVAHEGTEVLTNQSPTGGNYYFKITAQTAESGIWRTLLTVESGEADLYLTQGSLPSQDTYHFASERQGSDGFVLPEWAFEAAQEWFILVHATPGAVWSLVTGNAYVQDLGRLATDASSSPGPLTIGPEGMRYFKTSIPPETLAWALWLKGGQEPIFLRQSLAPHPDHYEQMQEGQMLVVPVYLEAGATYFVGISGEPGRSIELDSRAQVVNDLPFLSETSGAITGFGYVTYRVQVPVEQIAWQLTLASISGDAQFSVGQNRVPNEHDNEAFSEATAPVVDSITLVPPLLSDGTFYITVYGQTPYKFTLDSGHPVITDIAYIDSVVNQDSNRVGWRYYRVPNIAEQLGTLGWDLLLQNQAPGTEIHLRRNAVPGGTQARQYGSTHNTVHADFSGTANFLQRPAHQADIWYIGIFNPTEPLGSFQLLTRHLTFETLNFDGGVRARTSVDPGRWQFFHVEVPAGAAGWDLRLENVNAGQPGLVVRRDQLPESVFGSQAYSAQWPSGQHWAGGLDWTGYWTAADGQSSNPYMLAMGMGYPLEPGAYYVGVLTDPSSPAVDYILRSRGIGSNYSIPISDLEFSGGSVEGELAPREAAYYRVVIPPNTPTWKARLTALSGDVLLIASPTYLPNIEAAISNTALAPSPGREMQKIGDEEFLLLPNDGEQSLPEGVYYLTVVSEGIAPEASESRLGSGMASYRLESFGTVTAKDLGSLTEELAIEDTLRSGEVTAYQFNVPTGVSSFEVRLENRQGNPALSVRPGTGWPVANVSTGTGLYYYGHEGGQSAGRIEALEKATVANPQPGVYTITVKALANSDGTIEDASFTLRVRAAGPAALAFHDGQATVESQEAGTWQYFQVDVPTEAVGWDLRVIDVASGQPRMVIRRDQLPQDVVTTFSPENSTEWPTQMQWAPSIDITGLPYSNDGRDQQGQILAIGMGRPLEPGTYFVGVTSASGDEAMTYTIRSRGIGDGFSIPVVPLQFDGGVVTVSDLAPREIAYYSVEVPAEMPSWKISVSANAGDVALAVLKDGLPRPSAHIGSDEYGTYAPTGSGKLSQKLGDEQMLLLPYNGESTLQPGRYYLAVVSEGMESKPGEGRIGGGTSSFTLTSHGMAIASQLGSVLADPIQFSGNLAGGEVAILQFDVPPETPSVEILFENVTGAPTMALRQGTGIPVPDFWRGWHLYLYGQVGGQNNERIESQERITLASPTPGIYTLAIKASHDVEGGFPDASYQLTVQQASAIAVEFDGGQVSVNDQGGQSWRFFEVDVPSTASGWDLRLANVTSGTPRLVVRRDKLPNSFSTTLQVPYASTWASGDQWAAGTDFTALHSAEGQSEEGRVLIMGMGRPLEAGKYFIGVSSDSRDPLSYTLISRGIGDGLSLPIQEIPFEGEATGAGLLPREAAYFRVEVPATAANWKVQLSPTIGDASLIVLRNAIPSPLASSDHEATSETSPGKKMQIPGDEHFMLLPREGNSRLEPGTYYIAVVSEGVNPNLSENKIGIGTIEFHLQSFGTVEPHGLGILGSDEIRHQDTLHGGEIRLYQFEVAPGTAAVEVQLTESSGSPALAVRPGANPPMPNAWQGWWLFAYGQEGGQSSDRLEHLNIVTLPNPVPGIFTVAVKATHDSSGLFPDAAFVLQVRQRPVADLAFTSEEGTASRSGILIDQQRAFFKVTVPEFHKEQPLLGWNLTLTESAGLASVRVQKDALPSDLVGGMSPVSPNAVIVPPFLSPGVWFVEVIASGATAFTLTSSAAELQRPSWIMPAPGQATTTPGLTAPLFADTGIDTSGQPLPGDGGIDLARGHMHFYAVDIPAHNAGLLRTMLEALSGDPNLYIRVGDLPTISHSSEGYSGTLAERTLEGTGTEYGNWVPLVGRTETALPAGLWYFAVHAAGESNARYRLQWSLGSVKELSLLDGSFTKETLAAGDWRYYRVEIPATPPAQWHLSFSQQSGDVTLHLRDTVPPGDGTLFWWDDYRDWNTDGKSPGALPAFEDPGTHILQAPPIRPGNVYYLGFRAITDASFSIHSSTAGAPPEFPSIPFTDGTLSATLEAGAQITVRVDVPPDAVRWRHTSVHPDSVKVYLQQGTLPLRSHDDLWQSSGPDSTADYRLTGWPWVPNQFYYFTVVNTATDSQAFTLQMDGRTLLTDDDDGDGLPDSWEIDYFGSAGWHSALEDPDEDGNANLIEFQHGTDPTNAESYRAKLTLMAENGTVTALPEGDYFSLGTVVSVAANPDSGYQFESWSPTITGISNPAELIMDSHKVVVAYFTPANDHFTNAAELAGSDVHFQISNSRATRESNEPLHAGRSGDKSLWWRWTAEVPGRVLITTEGSTFDTLLAVYAGDELSNLAVVESNDDSGGQSQSALQFQAAAGISYAIAVDGWSGGSGTVNLRLRFFPSPTIAALQMEAGGSFQFAIHGKPGEVYAVEASTDLQNWELVQSLQNVDGSVLFSHPNPAPAAHRFYRVKIE